MIYLLSDSVNIDSINILHNLNITWLYILYIIPRELFKYFKRFDIYYEFITLKINNYSAKFIFFDTFMLNDPLFNRHIFVSVKNTSSLRNETLKNVIEI
jgi:hypothetical protein